MSILERGREGGESTERERERERVSPFSCMPLDLWFTTQLSSAWCCHQDSHTVGVRLGACSLEPSERQEREQELQMKQQEHELRLAARETEAGLKKTDAEARARVAYLKDPPRLLQEMRASDAWERQPRAPLNLPPGTKPIHAGKNSWGINFFCEYMRGLYSHSREYRKIFLRSHFLHISQILEGNYFGAYTCRACIRTRANTGKNSWRIIYVLVSCQGVISGPQKGPAERGHVKKSQKSSKSVKNIFDNFRAAPVFRPLLSEVAKKSVSARPGPIL